MSSEGLILATDDGEWAHGILHPSAEIPRTYRVLVHGEVRGDELVQLEAGVALADGITSPARASVVSNGVDGTWLELVVHEGRNRQVRRMLASVGHEVLRLLRTAIGPVELGDLRAGSWRRLETGEVDALRRGDGGG